ncbi:MAG: sigma-70 family RNA polymerase sigma factor [Myxococcaceae bacterium]|nr:sigma-70 family RNA polymerase sigma factor [Myxococcaceae bacterium]
MEPLRAAREAWPGIEIDPEQFAAHVESLRRAGGGSPEHLADVYLAFAATQGHAAALRAFDEHLLAGITPAVRGVDTAEDFIAEVRQVLRARLLVGTGDAPPRIAEYKGRGPLLAWVRIAAVRVALNLKRAEAPAAAAEDLLGELAASEPDPELRHLKTLYRAEFGAALREALAALSERQRVLLRLHYVDGLRLARIARLYQVHESTVSRWVSSAVDTVSLSARRRLIERLALSPSSFDSVARMVQSHLDLSIRRLLGGAVGSSDPGTS